MAAAAGRPDRGREVISATAARRERGAGSSSRASGATHEAGTRSSRPRIRSMAGPWPRFRRPVRKIQHGFEPLVPGFQPRAYNDLAAVEAAITAEDRSDHDRGHTRRGRRPMSRRRNTCSACANWPTEKNCCFSWTAAGGYFRTGRWQSYQRILGEHSPAGESFPAGAIAMAKSMGAGFPIGAVSGSASPTRTFSRRAPTARLTAARRWPARSRHGSRVVSGKKLADNIRARGDELGPA